jgi:hypothetical protein
MHYSRLRLVVEDLLEITSGGGGTIYKQINVQSLHEVSENEAGNVAYV